MSVILIGKMCLDTTNSTFQRALRRKMRSTHLLALGSVLSMVAILGIGYLFVGSLMLKPVLIAVMIAYIALASLISTIFMRKWKVLIDLVPKSAGMVCPRCAVAVDVDSDLSDASEAVCPRCTSRYRVPELRRYWDLFAAVGPNEAARSQPRAIHARAGHVAAVRAWISEYRTKLWPQLVWMAIIWLVAGIIFGLLRGSSLVVSLFTYAHMFIFMSAFLVLIHGWKSRVGDDRSCAACGYQRAPGDEHNLNSRCPECAADWNAVGGMTHGHIQRRPRLIIASVILVMVGVALIVSPLRHERWRNKVLPTSSLIKEIANPRAGFTYTEWNELSARALSASEVIELATALLDKRLDASYLDSTEETWLANHAAAGTLPARLVERYYREMLDIWIIAPNQANVGQSIELALGTTFRGGWKHNPDVLVSGFFIGDDPEPRGRQQRGIPGVMLGKQRIHIREDVGPGDGPTVTIRLDTAGSLTIQLELWLVCLPTPKTIAAIDWRPDGTPILPVGATWMERRVIKHVIDVRP